MKGTIQHVEYTQGSGLATIVVLTDDGDVQRIHCDAGPLFRATEGIQVSGRHAEFEMTDFGTCASFRFTDEEE